MTSVGPGGKERKETFDFLVVATGLNQTCSGLQLGPDGGNVVSHTCSIRGNRAFEGKRVVVVGLGESSSDATSDIANVASEVSSLSLSLALSGGGACVGARACVLSGVDRRMHTAVKSPAVARGYCAPREVAIPW